MTYAEARRRAMDSQNRIDNEKGETLKMTQTFVPEYMRPKQEENFYWNYSITLRHISSIFEILGIQLWEF